MDFETAFLVDVTTVVACTIVLIKYARLSHSHPGTIYLFFHFYTFTLRLVGVTVGAPTLFSLWGPIFDPVTENEITRAAAIADIALVVMTIAWVKASRRDQTKNGRIGSAAESQPNLRLRHIWSVVIVAFPLGVLGIWVFANLPGVEGSRVELGEWQTSSWFFITEVWAGLALLALIYFYGFRLWLIAPMAVYLLLMSYQGYHRFRVIIPAVLLIQIYLDRRGLRWPPSYVLAVILLLSALFFPLKDIGRMAQEQEAVAEIVGTTRLTINDALLVKAHDQQFLDMFASGLTLIDDAGHFYYGKTYLPLITLPIPRQWWPEKPGLADYIIDVSTPIRPMSEMGLIVTFLGESYANFGYLGILFVPYLLAYWLGRAYFRAYRSNYFSVARLSYLLVACNLILVYRDGLVSIVVFTWVNMMPLMIIVLLHMIFPLRPRVRASTIARPTYDNAATP